MGDKISAAAPEIVGQRQPYQGGKVTEAAPLSLIQLWLKSSFARE